MAKTIKSKQEKANETANPEASFALAETEGKGNRKRPTATQRQTKQGKHAHKGGQICARILQ